jgi:hypothetical protein
LEIWERVVGENQLENSRKSHPLVPELSFLLPTCSSETNTLIMGVYLGDGESRQRPMCMHPFPIALTYNSCILLLAFTCFIGTEPVF